MEWMLKEIFEGRIVEEYSTIWCVIAEPVWNVNFCKEWRMKEWNVHVDENDWNWWNWCNWRNLWNWCMYEMMYEMIITDAAWSSEHNDIFHPSLRISLWRVAWSSSEDTLPHRSVETFNNTVILYYDLVWCVLSGTCDHQLYLHIISKVRGARLPPCGPASRSAQL